MDFWLKIRGDRNLFLLKLLPRTQEKRHTENSLGDNF
jgi:hypothetical protein